MVLGIAGVLKVPIPSGIWLESQGFRLRICFINGLFRCFLVKFLFATLPPSLVADEVSPFFGEILRKLIRRTSRRIPRKVSGLVMFFCIIFGQIFFCKNSAKSINVAECEVCWISGKNTSSMFLLCFCSSFQCQWIIWGKRIMLSPIPSMYGIFTYQKSWLVSPASCLAPLPLHQKWPPGSLMMRADENHGGFP